MKLALLFNLLIGWAQGAEPLVSSDRFLIKIHDRTISLQDVTFQLRNVSSLECIYKDAFVIQYFGNNFVKELEAFVKKFPKLDDEVRKYLHGKEAFMKPLRLFFKLLRYSEDQRTKISPELAKVIREGTHENRCGTAVLYKDTLKTNFLNLVQMELYFRSRYGSQLKDNNRQFDSIRSSIDLFVDSLDKQLSHEYYW